MKDITINKVSLKETSADLSVLQVEDNVHTEIEQKGSSLVPHKDFIDAFNRFVFYPVRDINREWEDATDTNPAFRQTLARYEVVSVEYKKRASLDAIEIKTKFITYGGNKNTLTTVMVFSEVFPFYENLSADWDTLVEEATLYFLGQKYDQGQTSLFADSVDVDYE
jgi:hypothetical protein